MLDPQGLPETVGQDVHCMIGNQRREGRDEWYIDITLWRVNTEKTWTSYTCVD